MKLQNIFPHYDLGAKFVELVEVPLKSWTLPHCHRNSSFQARAWWAKITKCFCFLRNINIRNMKLRFSNNLETSKKQVKKNWRFERNIKSATLNLFVLDVF